MSNVLDREINTFFTGDLLQKGDHFRVSVVDTLHASSWEIEILGRTLGALLGKNKDDFADKMRRTRVLCFAEYEGADVSGYRLVGGAAIKCATEERLGVYREIVPEFQLNPRRTSVEFGYFALEPMLRNTSAAHFIREKMLGLEATSNIIAVVKNTGREHPLERYFGFQVEGANPRLKLLQRVYT